MHGLRGILTALALLACAPWTSAAAATDDMALGRPTAPVTVVEYASVGCPHCAVWANTVFPAFKARWIDTGQVRFVFREMLTGETNLAAAGFLTARCAGPAHYFQVVDAIFRVQADILADGDAKTRITAIAGQAGVTPERLKACLEDPAALAALEARNQRSVTTDGIGGTPTFVVGGQKLVGDQSLEALAQAIASARKAR